MLSQGRQDESPSFAPNGATLIYATQDRGRGVLATVSVDGGSSSGSPRARGDVREPVWSPFPAGEVRVCKRLAGAVAGFVAEFRAIFAVIPFDVRS